MGTQNESILAYGIIIPLPKLHILLQALRKLAQSPNAEEPIDRDDWDYEHYDEIKKRLTSILKDKVDYKFQFETLGDCEREWSGQAILYRGRSKDLLSKIDVWGTDPTVNMKRLKYKPWNDQELIEAANQAFKQIAELPVIKEVQIEVEPDWLQGISIG